MQCNGAIRNYSKPLGGSIEGANLRIIYLSCLTCCLPFNVGVAKSYDDDSGSEVYYYIVVQTI